MSVLHGFLQQYPVVLQKLNAHISPFGNVLLVILFSLLLIILRSNRKDKSARDIKKTIPKNANKITLPPVSIKDIKAIAGDNELATQLDLARAYFEMDQPKVAKKLLTTVLQHGNAQQQQEAKSLLAQFQLVSA